MIIYYKSFYIFHGKLVKNFIVEKIVIRNLLKIIKISEKKLKNQWKIGFYLETIKWTWWLQSRTELFQISYDIPYLKMGWMPLLLKVWMSPRLYGCSNQKILKIQAMWD